MRQAGVRRTMRHLHCAVVRRNSFSKRALQHVSVSSENATHKSEGQSNPDARPHHADHLPAQTWSRLLYAPVWPWPGLSQGRRLACKDMQR